MDWGSWHTQSLWCYQMHCREVDSGQLGAPTRIDTFIWAMCQESLSMPIFQCSSGHKKTVLPNTVFLTWTFPWNYKPHLQVYWWTENKHEIAIFRINTIQILLKTIDFHNRKKILQVTAYFFDDICTIDIDEILRFLQLSDQFFCVVLECLQETLSHEMPWHLYVFVT